MVFGKPNPKRAGREKTVHRFNVPLVLQVKGDEIVGLCESEPGKIDRALGADNAGDAKRAALRQDRIERALVRDHVGFVHE